MISTTMTARLLLALAFIVLSSLLTIPAAASEPPNFIVLMADDLGAKELGCYGHQTHRTPQLDRLADEGMRFRTCYATPLCSPTRVLLMTGRYAFRTGWFDLIGRPFAPTPDDPLFDLGSAQVTFADVLKERGYATALAGKWQLSGEGEKLVHDCGFDEYLIWAYKHNLPPGVTHTGAWENERNQKTARYWNPCLLENGKYVPTTPQDYGPDRFCDFLIDFMRKNRERPFLVYYPMCLVHRPWDPTPDLKRPGQKTKGGLATNVEYMDHEVGRFMAAIEDLGLGERTYLFFVGDNGTAKDGKGTVTERGVRVPLIVRGPDVTKGAVSDELASVADIFPTLTELAGARLPSDREIDGVSLVPTLHDPAAPHREWIFSYLTDRRMLRDKRWLLEGNGRFYDCGDHRDHQGYREVTDSQDPEVVAARERLEKLLEELPGPEIDGDRTRRVEERRRAKNKNNE
ncbi:MAG: sulfatase-like hydrolase/transferase [Pirellulales bacterium]|nr:sulfatase-like hydrolase/transferase [Pirellulales bacterium]